MKTFLINFFFLVLVVLLISCSKEKTKYFETIIINNTDYHINNITLDCSVEKVQKQIDSMDRTHSFILTYKEKKSFFLDALADSPMICSCVTSYSDTLTTFENSIGQTYPLNAFKEGQLNYIKIDLDPAPYHPTNKFIITVN